MATVIEAIYEGGVLRPLDDPALAAEFERRMTVLPDGRRSSALAASSRARCRRVPDDADPIAEALDDLRQERAARFEAELDAYFPTDPAGS